MDSGIEDHSALTVSECGVVSSDEQLTETFSLKVTGSPYSITERSVPELIPVLGSQPAGDVSHKPGGIGSHYFPPGLQLPLQP